MVTLLEMWNFPENATKHSIQRSFHLNGLHHIPAKCCSITNLILAFYFPFVQLHSVHFNNVIFIYSTTITTSPLILSNAFPLNGQTLVDRMVNLQRKWKKILVKKEEKKIKPNSTTNLYSWGNWLNFLISHFANILQTRSTATRFS